MKPGTLILLSYCAFYFLANSQDSIIHSNAVPVPTFISTVTTNSVMPMPSGNQWVTTLTNTGKPPTLTTSYKDWHFMYTNGNPYGGPAFIFSDKNGKVAEQYRIDYSTNFAITK